MRKIMNLFLMSLFLAVSAIPVFADQPDLELNGITTTSVNDPGEVAAISVFIRNLRTTEAKNFKSVIDISPATYKIVEGSLINTYESLAGGGSLVHTVKLTFDKRGSYSVKAVVDADNSVDEVKEDNNGVYTSIVVGQSAQLDFRFGECKIVLASDKEYEVEFMESAGNIGVFKVNGQVVKLDVGDATKLADGTQFELLGLENGMAASVYIPNVRETRPCTREVAPPVAEVPPPAPLPEPEKYETRKYPVPPPVPAEEKYGQCMNELAKLKDDINKHYEAGKEVSEDLMRKYDELTKYCETLHPGYQPPVRPLEKEEECIGCKRDHSCLQFGIRLVDEKGQPVYCDIDGVIRPQKQIGEQAQNNYECLSNTAADGSCISITERIEAVEREVREQRGLIEKIFDFFRRLFGG